MGAAFLGAISAMQSGSSKNKQPGGQQTQRSDQDLMRFLGDYGGRVGLGGGGAGGGGGGGAGGMMGMLGSMFLHKSQQPQQTYTNPQNPSFSTSSYRPSSYSSPPPR